MKWRRGGAELEEEDEEILVCFVVQSLCLFPQQICPPLPFALMCPAFAARYLEAPVIFPPLPFALMCPVFDARYLEANIVFPPLFFPIFCCSYCLRVQFLFALSLFNSLTVSLISFLIV